MNNLNTLEDIKREVKRSFERKYVPIILSLVEIAYKQGKIDELKSRLDKTLKQTKI